MTKLYTRSGDGGMTRLLEGGEVGKDDARVEAYGTVDETNVAVGAARVEVIEALGDGGSFIVDTLDTVQDALMRLAAGLASIEGGGIDADDGDVAYLEERIDAAQSSVGEIRHFLIPGASRAEASLHTARVVCRRAERRTVLLSADSDVPPVAVRYLNRLSDLLFVLARLCLHEQGVAEREWRLG